MSSRLPDTPARLDGLVNFRDTGGTPIASGGHTRAGVLYRSDALANLSPAGREALVLFGWMTEHPYAAAYAAPEVAEGEAALVAHTAAKDRQQTLLLEALKGT